jgi:hypothetical protein
MLGFLFPFIHRVGRPRIPSPEGAYLAVRDTGDNAARNVFEPHWAPPVRDIMNVLQRVGLSPGPEGCWPDLPFVSAAQTPYLQLGGILTQSMHGDNPLYTAPESAPESHIF